MSKPFGWWRFKMSSSIINSNIIQHRIKNRRTIHISIDLAVDTKRTVDLTKTEFGSLDFRSDEVFVKYIGFQSQHANNHNNLTYIACDFINENTTLAPFHGTELVQSFHNLRYTCKQNFDFRNTTFSVESILNNQEQPPVQADGNVLIGLEFVRYDRITDF